MTPEELEARAEEVLTQVPDWIWDGKKLPVPIDEIANSYFGLLVRPVDDMTAAPGAPKLSGGQTLSGLLLAAKGEIWVNAAEAKASSGRRRFTISHELGHWCLHRTPGQQPLFCRKTAVDEEDQGAEADGHSIEDEANIFAAALMMPGALMREQYERLRFEDECHARMCKLFEASGAAMGRRMHTAI